MNEYEVRGPLLRAEQLLLAVMSLIAWSALFAAERAVPDAMFTLEFRRGVFTGVLAAALAVAVLLRRGVLSTFESLRAIRGFEMVAFAYAMLVGMFLFGLLVQHAPGHRQAFEHMAYLASIMMIAHLVLVLASPVDRGLAMAQFNGLLLTTCAVLATPGASPAFLAYVLLLGLALVVRRHIVTLGGLASADDSVRLKPLLRHCLLIGVLILGTMLLLVPVFPDLSTHLEVEVAPRDGRTVSLTELIFKGLILIGALTLLSRLLTDLLSRERGEKRRKQTGGEEVEELLAETEGTVRLTGRWGRGGAGGSARARLIDEFLWLASSLATRGWPRPRWQTARELGDRVVRARPDAAGSFDELAALFEAARYSERPIGDDDVRAAHDLARSVLEHAEPLPQPPKTS